MFDRGGGEEEEGESKLMWELLLLLLVLVVVVLPNKYSTFDNDEDIDDDCNDITILIFALESDW